MGRLKFISFSGADGAGKTTIARGLSEALGGRRCGVELMGTMEIDAWATASDASLFHELIATVDTFEEGRCHKMPTLGTFMSRDEACESLFQKMAGRFYDKARQVIDDGGTVIVDSDPFLKGMMWAVMGKRREELRRWDALFIACRRVPDLVVHVTPAATPLAEFDAGGLLARIIARNGTATNLAEWSGDPVCIQEVATRLESAETTRRHLAGHHGMPVGVIVNNELGQLGIGGRVAEIVGRISCDAGFR